MSTTVVVCGRREWAGRILSTLRRPTLAVLPLQHGAGSDPATAVTCVHAPGIRAALAAVGAAGRSIAVLGPDGADSLPRAVADLVAAGQHSARVVALGPADPLLTLVTLASGADAYLPEHAKPSEVADAVRAVGNGRTVVPPALVPALVELLRAHRRGIVVPTGDGASHRLTQRQWDVLVLHLQRRTTAEIASMLFIAPATVRSHLASIHHTLGSWPLDEEP
jgi:DNA-binding NarL/FixJ family response regulator